MNTELFDAAPVSAPARGWRSVLWKGENLLLVLPLVALMLLPLIEMVLRRFHTGISGAAAFV